MSAIIEAAARALKDGNRYDSPLWGNQRRLAEAVLAAVTPLIRAAALEQAAKVIEEDRYYSLLLRDEIAAAIRALKE